LPSGGRQAEELLDIFMEEWHDRDAPAPRVSEVCTHAWRLLLPARVGAAQPRDIARRSARSFLLLRKLLMELLLCDQDAVDAVGSSGSEQQARKRRPSDSASDQEAALLQVSPELLGNLHEGMSLELGSLERFPCRIGRTSDGGERLLVQHGAWLMLARPQNVTPGRAVVTTLWPLQQVQPLLDRGDPRILHLGMQAIRAGKLPGDASEYSPPVPADATPGQRRSVFFMMSLSFKDVRSCHSADVQLQRGRREVRSQLLRQALDFIEGWQARAGSA